ncbi:MAG TPA: prepilin-type N-terminal cleavage/methylation domain-containing protein [Candidatus Paceibacterota bacterium]
MPLRAARSSSKRGFTLIELLVVMAIMLIITGIMLVNQARFDSSTVLRSLAYSVALSVRQAQVYGTSVYGTTNSSSITYASAYGIYFSAIPGQYILFADLNSNGKYDSGEDVKVFTLSSGYVISDFCAAQSGLPVPSNPQAWCESGGTISNLSILFSRPNPDACFATSLQTGPCAAGGTPYYSSAQIQIQNKNDPTNVRSIMVTTTGLISVQ